jgi:hypothetical protein
VELEILLPHPHRKEILVVLVELMRLAEVYLVAAAVVLEQLVLQPIRVVMAVMVA